MTLIGAPQAWDITTGNRSVVVGVIDEGIDIQDFRIDNVPSRLRALGDLWAPVLAPKDRFDLRPLL